MKSKLQYLYSITVFFGVLVTAYMMMSGQEDQLLLIRNQTRAPSLRSTEAQILDPALSQLLEVESALNQLQESNATGEQGPRRPAEHESIPLFPVPLSQ